MNREFAQSTWDQSLEEAWGKILDLAIEEDLGTLGDQTTLALVPSQASGQAAVVARKPGVAAGLRAAAMTAQRIDPDLQWSARCSDGHRFAAGETVAELSGPVRGLLSAERPLLNVLGRLSGIATLTRQYVDAVQGTAARIYDTRKTTPGWRRLEKYAVRCGGGCNHRLGLHTAVLIKDNHLAFGAQGFRPGESGQYQPAQAVEIARRYLQGQPQTAEMIVEIEVDTLDQLAQVLPARPDIVLLDNMTAQQLRQAVQYRDAHAPGVELEASGGISLEGLRAIAETGIQRISVGALTHSAVSLDFGLDWLG